MDEVSSDQSIFVVIKLHIVIIIYNFHIWSWLIKIIIYTQFNSKYLNECDGTSIYNNYCIHITYLL